MNTKLYNFLSHIEIDHSRLWSLKAPGSTPFLLSLFVDIPYFISSVLSLFIRLIPLEFISMISFLSLSLEAQRRFGAYWSPRAPPFLRHKFTCAFHFVMALFSAVTTQGRDIPCCAAHSALSKHRKSNTASTATGECVRCVSSIV